MYLAVVGIATRVVQIKGQTHFNSCRQLRRKSAFSLSLEEINVGNKKKYLINIEIKIKQAKISKQFYIYKGVLNSSNVIIVIHVESS